MTHIIHQYIDGSWTDAADGNVAELINPATGEVTGAVEQGSESDVDHAVAAARRAFSSFSRISPEERAANDRAALLPRSPSLRRGGLRRAPRPFRDKHGR